MISSQPAAPAEFARVRRVNGFDRIRAEYPAYLSDESKLTAGPFEDLFFPLDEGELAAVLREMAVRRAKVTIAGARTGLVGGCVPQEGALVSLENFDRVRALQYNPAAGEWLVGCQCAVSLRSLDAQVAAKRFPDLKHCGDAGALSAVERVHRGHGGHQCFRRPQLSLRSDPRLGQGHPRNAPLR